MTRKIRKPDVSNEDQGYWELVLESHGLGIRQLGLQEGQENPDQGEMTEVK